VPPPFPARRPATARTAREEARRGVSIVIVIVEVPVIEVVKVIIEASDQQKEQ
jgi:hypothetical protein